MALPCVSTLTSKQTQLIGLSYKAKQMMRGFGRRGSGGPGDPVGWVVRLPLQDRPQACPCRTCPCRTCLQDLEDRAVVRVDSDLKARKPGSPDNSDRVDSGTAPRTHSRRARNVLERNPG